MSQKAYPIQDRGTDRSLTATLMAALAALGKGLALVDTRVDPDQLHQLLDPTDED